MPEDTSPDRRPRAGACLKDDDSRPEGALWRFCETP
jgi:hypothetical protein